MKRRFKPGMLAGLLILVILMGQSFISSWLSPTLAEQYNNTALYRPWSVPVMWIIFLYPFFLGLALAWIWEKMQPALKGNGFTKVMKFAFAYWVVGVVPTMIMIYSCFPVTKWVVIIWTISGFVYGLVSALVFARMIPQD